ncbi:MAG: substrate-binding domain-containing protein [Pseudomonadota bacterium]|nr:substrate-binding domain-containing protein [Pseudomonadota bacterium]
MRRHLTTASFCLALAFAGSAAAQAQDVVLYGAGSLRAVMTDITQRHAEKHGTRVSTSFGPSGLMRQKIEAGDAVDLFTSADMGHAMALARQRSGSTVMVFTRNRLCAFAAPQVQLTPDNFASKLLDPAIGIGTSTPNADPGGDYTWQMFRLLDKNRPGAFDTLDRKAQKLVGGSTTADPANPDPIGAAFRQERIQVAFGYCSGAQARLKANPGLTTLPVPPQYAPAPMYGMVVLTPGKPGVAQLALDILSVDGQATLARHGFAPIGDPGTGAAPQ